MLKYLFLFIRKYKVKFCNKKAILFSELDYTLFNGRFDDESSEIFLFEISERKTKKIIYIISLNKNTIDLKINKLN